MSNHATESKPYYVTTPIYYVNDRPHIGHCYTTLIADVAARAQRLAGREVFFLTGTDEHAEKVSQKAIEMGKSPYEWATMNAEEFRAAFDFMGFSNDDFVRTAEDRRKERASAYIGKLMEQGDIELGDYEGWYDPSQEEYLTETVAKENDYKSPVTGRELEKRVEQNYFFRLDKYEDWLRGEIESGAIRVLPEARKNEVLGRLKQGLMKVPVSRKIKEGDADWGIKMPGDDAGMVQSRASFLDSGLYQPLAEAIEKLSLTVLGAKTAATVVDAGCGEGYYSDRLRRALLQGGVQADTTGFDISKFAVRAAARRNKAIDWFVANSSQLPLDDSSTDLLLSLFSPLPAEEFARVCHPTSRLIVASTGPEHLLEMREQLYDTVDQQFLDPGKTLGAFFDLEQTETIGTTITLNSSEEIGDLLTMTPHYWRAKPEKKQALCELEALTVTLDFRLHCFKPTAK